MHNVDIRNVSLGQIQYFIKVAEYKNISKAAEYFNLSQPTLSKKLKSLEMQMDLQLFIRSSKSITLTPAGKYLYEAWREKIHGLEQDIQYAQILQGGYSKSIVVACLDSFRPETFLVPAVEQFQEKYSDVQIRIESDAAQDIRKMLIHGEVDVIFSILYDVTNRENEQIEWRVLGSCQHCACMLKTNPLAKKKSLKMEDLKQSDFVCISPQYLPEYLQLLQNLCAEASFAPNVRNYVVSANSLTLNIQTDNDVFICDRYYADMRADKHVLIPIEDTQSGYIVAWNKMNKNPYLQNFLTEAIAFLENRSKEYDKKMNK